MTEEVEWPTNGENIGEWVNPRGAAGQSIKKAMNDLLLLDFLFGILLDHYSPEEIKEDPRLISLASYTTANKQKYPLAIKARELWGPQWYHHHMLLNLDNWEWLFNWWWLNRNRTKATLLANMSSSTREQYDTTA